MLALMVRRSLWNNARITAWALLTLGTCAALVTLFTTATFEVGHKLGHELRTLGANAVAYPATATAQWTQFDAVAQRLGVRTASLSLRVQLINGKPVAVVAADPQRLADLTPYWSVTGVRGDCLAGQRVVAAFGWKLGQEINFDGDKRRLTGIIQTGDEDEERVFISGAAPATNDFRYALVSVAGGEAAIEQLQRALAGTGIELKPLRQVLYGEQHVLEKVNVLFVTTLGAVLLLTALGVSASMLARVVERRKEFALLQALGAKRRAVVKFLLAESATVGVMAAVAGFLIGSLLASVMVQQIFHASVGPQWAALAAALGTTTLVSLLAGGIACGRTLRFQPAAALRGE
jgi:putative ABC transport system permease protein